MLNPIERPDRDETADTRWRRFDVEREVLALGERRQAPVRAVAYDRPQARQLILVIALATDSLFFTMSVAPVPN